jgi:hypothetical protein
MVNPRNLIRRISAILSSEAVAAAATSWAFGVTIRELCFGESIGGPTKTSHGLFDAGGIVHHTTEFIASHFVDLYHVVLHVFDPHFAELN